MLQTMDHLCVIHVRLENSNQLQVYVLHVSLGLTNPILGNLHVLVVRLELILRLVDLRFVYLFLCVCDPKIII